MKAQMLFYKYFDFEHACEILTSAKQICEQNHFDDIMPSILLEEAGFYTTYASQNPSKENFAIGEKAYRESFELSIKQKDKRTMASAFSNMINRFYGEHRIKEMNELLASYGKMYNPADTAPNLIFANALYNGFSKVIENDNISARQIFKKASLRQSIDPRHRFELNVAIVRTFISENKLDSAIVYEHHLLKLSRECHLKDGEAVALADLGNLYHAVGDTVNARFFNYSSMQKKDSLINVRRLDKVHNMTFLQTLYNLEQEAKNSKQTSKILKITISAVALLLLIGCIMVFYRNARLKKKHDAEQTEPTALTEKYQNSTLSDFSKDVITKRIAEIINKPDEAIFDSAFNISTLASMCKTNTHYVSQIINDLYGVNFSALINQVRIKEACRRISDTENYGNYTLESIGLSVGYASRVSFSNAFKRIKSITPSQYRDSLL